MAIRDSYLQEQEEELRLQRRGDACFRKWVIQWPHAVELAREWMEAPGMPSEGQDSLERLERLAAAGASEGYTQVRREAWGLASGGDTSAESDTSAERRPQAMVLIDPHGSYDGQEYIVVQDLWLCPFEAWSPARQALRDYVDSLAPQQVAFRKPEALAEWGLELLLARPNVNPFLAGR